MNRTFIMVKPDGVQRGLVGEIVKRFEEKGLKLSGAKFMQVSDELAKEHYKEHVERPFFRGISRIYNVWPCICYGLARGECDNECT